MAGRVVMTVVALALVAPWVARADGKKVAALNKKGQALWRNSCPGPFLASCVRRKQVSGRAASNRGGRCSAGTATRVKKRNTTRARAAQTLFARTLSQGDFATFCQDQIRPPRPPAKKVP